MKEIVIFMEMKLFVTQTLQNITLAHYVVSTCSFS